MTEMNGKSGRAALDTKVSETEASRLSDHLQHDHPEQNFVAGRQVLAPGVEAAVRKAEYKAVDFIETYTGRPFFPLAPDPNALSMIDMAHHLSQQCRYAGATNFHYSIAQHSCLLATYAGNVLKASALDCLQVITHDTPEFALPDMPRPIKKAMPEYRAWDAAIDSCIRHWLGLDNVPVPDFLAEIDSRIIPDERRALKAPSGLDWGNANFEPLGIAIKAWTPMYAEQQFLLQWAAYSNAVYGCHNYLRVGWGVPMQARYTDADDKTSLVQLIEVDLRGNVGRIKADNERGWSWLHGRFEMTDVKVR